MHMQVLRRTERHLAKLPVASCSRQSRQRRVTILVILILSSVLFTCLAAGRGLPVVAGCSPSWWRSKLGKCLNSSTSQLPTLPAAWQVQSPSCQGVRLLAESIISNCSSVPISSFNPQASPLTSLLVVSFPPLQHIICKQPFILYFSISN